MHREKQCRTPFPFRGLRNPGSVAGEPFGGKGFQEQDAEKVEETDDHTLGPVDHHHRTRIEIFDHRVDDDEGVADENSDAGIVFRTRIL